MGDLVLNWVNKGNQRRAVYDALSLPRTGRQVLQASSRTAARMTLQDVRKIVRRLEDFGRVVCLNPEEQTGRIYQRRDAPSRFSEIDWKLYSRIARAKARAQILTEIGTDRIGLLPKLNTATGIKRSLRNRYPTSLNMTIDILAYLKEEGLVEIETWTPKRNCKVYRLTETGRKIVQVLKEASRQTEPEQPEPIQPTATASGPWFG